MAGLFRVAPRVIESVSTPVDRGEVLRYMGYPAGFEPPALLAQVLDPWIERAANHASPRAIYLVLPVVEKRARLLKLEFGGGTVEFVGAIGEFLGPAQGVAPFIATAGPEIDCLAGELSDRGEMLPALVVNAVGAERAEAAESMVIDELRSICGPLGLAPTLPYSPGYCGMKLTEQRTLFGLFEGADPGVALTEHCLMRPLKSVSGLIGLGPADQVEEDGSPCDRCELHNCAMRR